MAARQVVRQMIRGVVGFSSLTLGRCLTLEHPQILAGDQGFWRPCWRRA